MFASLPVITSAGERLSHEEVVNRLQSETVKSEVSLAVSGLFKETVVANIVVETARYETAVRWLKDLVYGSEFDKER